jgi:hypothetical protein
MTPEEQQEYTAELLRMVERYKAGEAGRRVPMLEAAQMQGQPAGNAQAIPTTTFGGPDVDEYAYLGTPSPPVQGQPGMPQMGPPPPPAQPESRLPSWLQQGSLRRGLDQAGVIDALGPSGVVAKSIGPHAYDVLTKAGTIAQLATPRFGTDADIGTPLEQGDYGRAASATALGTAGAALDMIPGEAAVKGILKGITGGFKKVKDFAPEGAMALGGALKGGRSKAAEEATEFLTGAPAIVRDEATAATEKILEHAAKERRPTYPPATQPVFKGDETGELTRELVPQTSIRDQIPRPEPGTKAKDLPANARSRIIAENVEPISDIIARDLRPMVEANARPGQFYHTGGVLQGLTDIGGLSPAESLGHMGRWSGQGAATSPRTATPQNLRNASYLNWRQAQGNPLTLEQFTKEGNQPGFAMMGMHARLGDEFAQGTVNINKNPKPSIFQRNWSGNLADVTGDTHNIRATLAALDELHPGKLPREWFVSDEAHKAYKKRGGFGQDPLPVGDIKDTLEGATKNKVYKQTEYGIMTDPWYRAAEKLGIDPATGQAHGWFGYGGRTGLMSPEATIDDLLNAQIEATSRATGLHPEKILQLWGRGRIPLAEAPGGDGQSKVG